MDFATACLIAKGEDVKPEDVLSTFPNIRNLDDLFRLAHIHEFKHDIAPSIRVREVAAYRMNHNPPIYVKRYLDRFKIT